MASHKLVLIKYQARLDSFKTTGGRNETAYCIYRIPHFVDSCIWVHLPNDALIAGGRWKLSVLVAYLSVNLLFGQNAGWKRAVCRSVQLLFTANLIRLLVGAVLHPYLSMTLREIELNLKSATGKDDNSLA